MSPTRTALSSVVFGFTSRTPSVSVASFRTPCCLSTASTLPTTRWASLFDRGSSFARLLSPGDVPAQSVPDRPAAGVNRETGTPGSAGPKDDGVVQRGTQPNPGEVRPGNRDGDQPSASAGELQPRTVQRIFGLPVTAALII